MDYRDILRTAVNELAIDGENVDSGDSSEDEAMPSMDDDSGDSGASDGGDDEAMPSMDDDSGDEGDTSDGGDDEMPSMDDDSGDSEMSDDGSSDDEMPSMDDDSDDEGSSDGGSDDMGGGDDEMPSMDDDSGDEGDTSDGESENGEDSEEGSEEGNDEDPIEKIKKIEDELFSNLTDEQMSIKNSELKGQFITLYSTIGSTLVRINDIPKSESNIEILKFITDKLLELREMIDFNITKAYKTRSYIENSIIYQQCIATLNAIGEIISNLPNITPNPNPGAAEIEQEKENKGEPVETDDSGSEILDISDVSVSDYREESYNYSSYNSLF